MSKIFLSYASEDRALAEDIQLALSGAGHDVFFDRRSLPAGGDYHERIRRAVGDADLFVFLISPDSVDAGGYALTEVGYARDKWAHPKGRVLPVMGRTTPFASIPAYLKSVTLLEPSGNVPAEVADAVAKLFAAAPDTAVGGESPARAEKSGDKAGTGGTLKLGLLAGAVLMAGAAAVFFKPWAREDPEVARLERLIEPALPNPLQLRFSLVSAAPGKVALDDTLRVNLQAPRIVDGERLAQQPQGYFVHNTAYPAAGEKVLGTVARELRESTLSAAPAPANFCLQRPDPLLPSAETYVHLDCNADSNCKLHFPSPKWLEACAVEAPKTSFSLFAQAVAATTEQRKWSVPSARTLAAHEGKLKGVGYTLIDIQTDIFQDPTVIGVEVDVRVNGVAILEDGLLPSQRPVPNDPAKPFRHSYALESLDFQGAQAGCEAITLTLRPRLAGGKGPGAAQTATLAYVALRDKSLKTIPFGPGSLTWSARYVIPADEWSHEAFITSLSYSANAGEDVAAATRARAVALKQDFDRLGLSFEGRPLVAVIRPPLTLTGDRLAYGLTAGAVQPSGQVRFTFSFDEANRIADAMLARRAADNAAKGIINRDKYIYKAAGTKERQGTPTPPGVCQHVKAV